ncbi:extracellular solute-binding protein [Polynucleobacter sphagniphilus]|jgi:microcin C transport system substrate-binding protein|uniref:Microcin C transport system substrate-binding protein n=1 Tax=Polynucleobacter sphagniphilus TaxID=1743169 RepID=A0AA43S6Z4_9BURK|nr:extracellular solute-binding protein [Polynucleobacter sphagniphilus]MDF9788231.1 microcin C transport system substrate-binding protein [Polynucleobacter sphagniphilus]MDH6154859.1 microcin C transport system substrate-binding protein [Polynucleobacter sphagniphilus]MDH6241101.1 microcin C transport system substrate-binding protein [Polynucleobacter sphagniphilus]MDH6248763.1 microcin C transport system substrate-binding protein [Polynucleobacter sphagniphilus]MDH6300543.1 microcin C transp
MLILTPIRRATQIVLLGLLLGLGVLSAQASQGISQYGKPKYPDGFSHFDYVNPNAPRGGTLTLPNPGSRSSFDKFNPFTLRGVTAPGIELMFESLAEGSADEVSSIYGLLADDIQVAADHKSVIFHIRPEAKFSDGSPVLAADVKYSFDTLMSGLAHPRYKTTFADVKSAVVLSPREVRFDFKNNNSELPIMVGTLPIFSRNWGKRPDGSMIPFDQLAFEMPIGSGPYLIESFKAGKSILFKRNPNYWVDQLSKPLNVRVGFYNFDRVLYKLYSDDAVRLEAFKAGEFDALVEYRAKIWAKGYVGSKFNDGSLLKKAFTNHNGAGMQGFAMNQRRPIFQDPRVREALGYALDFEWLNRQLFFDQYSRINSYFTNSDLSANFNGPSKPTEAELKILKPLKEKYPKWVPDAVFGPMPAAPSTAPPSSLRNNLRKARELLAQAGWQYRDGALRNMQGEPFRFEMVEDGPFFLRVISAYTRNLEKLGIQVDVRTSDFALHQKRMDEYDFDMTTVRFPDSQNPGNELWDRFGSAAAKEKGSDNVIGVQSPVVDALVNEITKAQNREELRAAARSLDRVLWNSYYVIPQWYNPTHRIAFRKEMRYPEPPLYYSAEPWVMQNWWKEESK